MPCWSSHGNGLQEHRECMLTNHAPASGIQILSDAINWVEATAPSATHCPGPQIEAIPPASRSTTLSTQPPLAVRTEEHHGSEHPKSPQAFAPRPPLDAAPTSPTCLQPVSRKAMTRVTALFASLFALTEIAASGATAAAASAATSAGRYPAPAAKTPEARTAHAAYLSGDDELRFTSDGRPIPQNREQAEMVYRPEPLGEGTMRSFFAVELASW